MARYADPVVGLEAFAVAAGTAAAAAGFWSISREAGRALGALRKGRDELIVDEFLLNAIQGRIDADVESTIAAVLKEVTELRHHSTISMLSGRLVFSATDLSGKRYVVKTTLGAYRTDRARASLFNEAMILSHLGGVTAPRLVRVASTRSGTPFVVREMVKGASLDRVLFECADLAKPPKLANVAELLAGIATVVGKLHSLNVVHGDLKPANILAQWSTEGGSRTAKPVTPVTLLDFESATILGGAADLGLQSLSRGTPFFMAPERYAVSRVGTHSDIYSLSALAALLLTGRPVRPGTTAGQRIDNTRLREIVRRGMSVEPTHRPSSVEEWNFEVQLGLAEMVERLGPASRVDWPKDSLSVKTEVAEQAVTVSVSPRYAFRRVARGVDSATLDGVVREAVAHVEASTRSLLESVWFDGTDLEEAAKTAHLSVTDAQIEIENFASQLDRFVRSKALERDRVERSSS